MKKKIIVSIMILFVVLNVSGVSAWEKWSNGGTAREIYWVYGCTNNPSGKCGPNEGTNYSTVSTNNTNRWIRSSVTANGSITRSPKSGVSKTINGIVYNATNARASRAVLKYGKNERFYDFMSR